MPQNLSAVSAHVDRNNDDLSSEATQIPTKDDMYVLLLCEKLIANGEADSDPETGQLVDRSLRRLSEKYPGTEALPPILRSVPTDTTGGPG